VRRDPSNNHARDGQETSASTAISTTVDLDATPEVVWAVLTDFAAYPQWNPFIDRVTGSPSVGEKLIVHMKLNRGRGMTFKPTVLAATPGRELRWLGKLGVSGLLDGEHSFLLDTKTDGTTHLTHGETFSGVLVALMKRTLPNTEAGFTAFNQALKQRVGNAGQTQPNAVASPPRGSPR
jgi:hypothetical protein